jgi:hypothetical protein
VESQAVHFDFLEGTAAHRSLADNAHLWEGRPRGEVHHILGDMVATTNKLNTEVWEGQIGRGASLPVYDLQGPSGFRVAHLQRWQHRGTQPVYLVHEFPERGKPQTSALLSGDFFVSEPDTGWFKVTGPMVPNRSSFELNGSLIMSSNSTAGRLLSSRTAELEATDLEGVRRLPESVIEGLMTAVRGPKRVVRDAEAFVSRKLSPWLGRSEALQASSSEMIRWAFFGEAPTGLV